RAFEAHVADGSRAVLYVSSPAPLRRRPQRPHPPAIRRRSTLIRLANQRQVVYTHAHAAGQGGAPPNWALRTANGPPARMAGVTSPTQHPCTALRAEERSPYGPGDDIWDGGHHLETQ